MVMLFDKPTMRLPHFVERVEQINTDPRRQPIKAGLLDDVLRRPAFLEMPLLRDPRNDAVPMIGSVAHAKEKLPQVKMDFAMAG